MMKFDDVFRAQLRELLIWRRDVRRFRTEALPPGTVERLIDMACLAPSVGLSQPWRFVIVDEPARRRAVLEDFRSCNADALNSYADNLAAHYAKLKLAGLEEAPSQVAVFAEPATETGHGLGRRTMPEMIEYSVVAAIHTMWLAARADGIAMGWLSILTPGHITRCWTCRRLGVFWATFALAIRKRTATLPSSNGPAGNGATLPKCSSSAAEKALCNDRAARFATSRRER